jgi:hypothetical protein
MKEEERERERERGGEERESMTNAYVNWQVEQIRNRFVSDVSGKHKWAEFWVHVMTNTVETIANPIEQLN